MTGFFEIESLAWLYRARTERVVDGDTLDLVLDLGFGVELRPPHSRVRLGGVDTAEVYGVDRDSEEYELGLEHARFVEDWIDEAVGEFPRPWPLLVKTYDDDSTGKYGRFAADVFRRSDGACLSADLVEQFPDVESSEGGRSR